MCVLGPFCELRTRSRAWSTVSFQTLSAISLRRTAFTLSWPSPQPNSAPRWCGWLTAATHSRFTGATRFLGNARLAPCSKVLKQQPARKWLQAHADPATTTLYVGIDASETRRIPGIRVGWVPWTVEFPLTEEPELTKETMLAEARALGLTPPRAYEEGFAHANFNWTNQVIRMRWPQY
jgi:hypothetical protein